MKKGLVFSAILLTGVSWSAFAVLLGHTIEQTAIAQNSFIAASSNSRQSAPVPVKSKIAGIVKASLVPDQIPADCLINSFNATTSPIPAGSASGVNWNTSNCSTVYLYSSYNTTKVSVSAVGYQNTPYLSSTTTYYLDAYDSGNALAAQASFVITVNGGSGCSINSFSATPATVSAGQTTTLSWTSSNCPTLTLSGGQWGTAGTTVSNASTGSQVTNALSASTTYTLSGSGLSMNATVSVGNSTSCTVSSFTASPSTVQAGQSATLNWAGTCLVGTLSGGQFTASYPNGKIVAGTGSDTTGPITATTTYTFTTGSDTKTVTVNVGTAQACTINSFTATNAPVTSGTPATLAWTSSNCTGPAYVFGDPSNQTFSGPVNGSVSTTPLTINNVTFTLSIDGVQKNISVPLANSCGVISFSATPSTITSGQTTDLSWSINPECITGNFTHTISGIGLPGGVYGITTATGHVITSPLTQSTSYILSAGAQTKSIAITVNSASTLQFTSPSILPDGYTQYTQQQGNYQYQFAASGGTAPYTYSQIALTSGTGYPCCTFNVSPTGFFASTANTILTAGTYNINVRVTDAAGNYADKQFTWSIVPYVANCVVNSITATPSSVNIGQTTTLSWSTTNCDGATLSGGQFGAAGVNTGTNSTQITQPLYANVTYTVSAYKLNNAPVPGKSVTVTIAGTAGCVINSFTSNPDTLTSAQPVILNWSASSACTGGLLSGGQFNNQGVPLSGMISTNPLSATTTYTLRFGSVNKSVTITFGSAQCSITSFTASAGNSSAVSTAISVAQGTPTNLNWATSNCASAVITAPAGSPNSSGMYFNAAPVGSGSTFAYTTNLGTTTYTLTAQPGNVSKSFAITVTNSNSTINFTTTSLPDAVAGTPYTADINFSYTGTGCLSASISGQPAGINLAGQTACFTGSKITISGTPTQAGSYNVNVSINDNPAAEVTKVFTLIVKSATGVCSIDSFTASAGNSSAVSTAISVAQGTPTNLNWATSNCASAVITAPAGSPNSSGMYFNAAPVGSGSTFAYTTNLGTTTYTLTAQPGNVSKSFAITVTSAGPCVIQSFAASDGQTSATALSVDMGAGYSLDWNTQNCTSLKITDQSDNSWPYTTPSLVNSSKLTLVAVNQGTTTYTLTAQPGNISKTLTVTVSSTTTSGISISPINLPDATVGQPYSYQLQASNGIAPYSWTVLSTTYPTACCVLGIDGSGLFNTQTAANVVNGYPAGTYSWVVKVTDSVGKTATKTVYLKINSDGQDQNPNPIPSGAHAPGSNLLAPDGAVYFVDSNSQRRLYPTYQTFLSYPSNNISVLVNITDADLQLPLGDPMPMMEGTIIKDTTDPNGTIYLITGGKRSAFTSLSVFNGLGYVTSNLLYGDTSFLGDPGAPIYSAKQRHLPGTLFKETYFSKCVYPTSALGINDCVPNISNPSSLIERYYISTCTGKLGVPSMSVLDSWGYKKISIAKTVIFKSAVLGNAFDVNAQQESVMQARAPGQVSIIPPCSAQ